jgi:hypothetical protein
MRSVILRLVVDPQVAADWRRCAGALARNKKRGVSTMRPRNHSFIHSFISCYLLVERPFGRPRDRETRQREQFHCLTTGERSTGWDCLTSPSFVSISTFHSAEKGIGDLSVGFSGNNYRNRLSIYLLFKHDDADYGAFSLTEARSCSIILVSKQHESIETSAVAVLPHYQHTTTGSPENVADRTLYYLYQFTRQLYESTESAA